LSAVVGERDRALRSTIPRNINPTAGKDLLLDADPGAVHFNYDGTATTPTITLTAKPIGFDATVLWSIAGGGVLSGTGKNVRTMAASSMTSASVRVVITSVFEGQAYIAARTIFKSTDGKPGLDGTPADLSPASLLAALEGRITDSQLYADLRAKINLITDPVSQPGSVQAQVKAETDARVAAIGTEAQIRNNAIGQEVADRIAAVLAESGARTTYVQNYTFSKAEVNSALSIQATQIAAANTYTDTKTGAAISTAAADVRNYSYSKADTTSAISAAETRLRAEFVSGNGATEAYVQNWSYSKAASDSAEATQTATLTTSYQGYADQKKSEAKVDAAADVRNYAYSKAAIDSSEAAQSATLTTNHTAYADAARVSAVSTASADVRQYAYSKSTVDSAISSAIQELRSEFVGSSGATEGFVTNYAYSKSQIDQAEALQSNTLTTSLKNYTDSQTGLAVTNANAFTQQYAYAKSAVDGAISSLSTQITANYKSYSDAANVQTKTDAAADVRNYSVAKADLSGAIAQATSSLSTTVGQHTTTIQQQATSIGGLSAQYTVKIDNNGRVSGYGLASTPINGAVYSIFAINADAFSVGAPGVANKQMFTVGQVNGQVAMVVRGDVYADGDITARMLKIGTSDNIVPDPEFRDLGWWGRLGLGSVGFWADAGQATGWLAGSSLYLAASAGESFTYSKPFPITPGATYLVQCQVNLSADFNGRLSLFWTTQGVVDFNMIGSAVSNWSDGLQVHLNSTSAKGLVTFTRTFTMPVGGSLSRSTIQIRNSHTVGTVEIGSVSITRVVDSTLIGPGVVETKHLIIDKGGAIYSGQSGFDLGDGFWLEGANADHGARLSLGNSSGAKILADPRRGIFGLYNFPIINPQLAQKTITGLYNIVGMNGIANNTKQSLGSQTASMSNASGAVNYVWSTEVSNGTLTIVPNGASCAFYAQAPRDGRCQGNINCTGTDGSGFSASTSILVDVGFGSGVPT
jgi:hypothetical protein